MVALSSMAKLMANPNDEAALVLSAEIARLAPTNLYVLELGTGTLSWTNGCIFTSLGYSSAYIAAQGAHFAMAILHPDDRPMAEARFVGWDRANRHKQLDFIQRIRHKDGQWRWFACTEKVFRTDDAGHVTHILGASLDVTERQIDDARKRREVAALQKQISESFKNYERLADSIPQLVWVTDAQGKALYYNQPWLDYTGIDVADDGGTWNSAIHREDLAAALTIWSASLLSGAPYSVEYRLRAVDGRYRWHLARGIPVQDETGHIMWFGTCTDIDDAKKAAQALEQSHKLEALVATQQQIATARLQPQELMALVAQRALEHIGADAVFVTRVIDDCFVLQATAGDTHLTPGFKLPIKGSLASICLTENRTLLLHDAQRDAKAAGGTKLANDPRSVLITPLRGPEGPIGTVGASCNAPGQFDSLKHRTLELLANLLSAAIAQYTALHSRDEAIDLFKEAERRLITAKLEAEATAEAKADFLASMSHEIRTPLNGIIGMSEILMETPLSGLQLKYLQTVRSSGNILLTVVNDILDFSKIEAGQLVLESVALDLVAAIETQVAIVAKKAQDKGLRLWSFIDPRLRGAVRGDPFRIGQAVLNFLSNAIKFTNAGSVRVRATVDSGSDGSFFMVAVTDTGIGLSADAQAQLFKPFAQASAMTARKYGGTGLGLSITKKLVEQMGGQTGVMSDIGQGSTFWLRLPYNAVSGKKPQEASAAQPFTTLRIACISDDPQRSLDLAAYASDLGAFAQTFLLDSAEVMRLKGAFYHVALIDLPAPEPTDRVLMDTLNTIGQACRALIVFTPSRKDFVAHLLEGPKRAILILAPHQSKADILRGIAQVTSGTTATLERGGDKQDEARESVAIGAAPAKHGAILVCDDNAVNQFVAMTLLRSLGYDCDTVEDGHSALEALEQKRYDLVLMDCQMPVMDGFEATRRIRAREKATGEYTPIVALTAGAQADDRIRCETAGMDAYLSKPIKKQDLQRMLESWVKRRDAKST